MTPKPINFDPLEITALLAGRKSLFLRPPRAVDGWCYPKECPYTIGDDLFVREPYRIDTFGIHYRIDSGEAGVFHDWQPARSMPRNASRFHLRVTQIDDKRTCDLTTDEIRADGIECSCRTDGAWKLGDAWNKRYRNREWWDCGFIWIVRFERVEP
jgi:hypothetical protein